MFDYKLFKRNKYWQVDAWVDGIRIRKSTRCSKKEKAENMAKLIIQKKLKEIYGRSEYLLSQLIAKYITQIKIENKTWRDKIIKLKRFIEFIGDRNLSDIVASDCQDFINDIVKSNVSKATVNRYIATIRHLFNKAIDWDMINKNPVNKIKMFKEQQRLRFYSSHELERLIEAAKKISQENVSNNQFLFYYIMTTAIYTGMRLGEIINLKWMDYRDGFFVIHNSKSGLKRMVPVKDELMAVLLELPSPLNTFFR